MPTPTPQVFTFGLDRYHVVTTPDFNNFLQTEIHFFKNGWTSHDETILTYLPPELPFSLTHPLLDVQHLMMSQHWLFNASLRQASDRRELAKRVEMSTQPLVVFPSFKKKLMKKFHWLLDLSSHGTLIDVPAEPHRPTPLLLFLRKGCLAQDFISYASWQAILAEIKAVPSFQPLLASFLNHPCLRLYWEMPYETLVKHLLLVEDHPTPLTLMERDFLLGLLEGFPIDYLLFELLLAIHPTHSSLTDLPSLVIRVEQWGLWQQTERANTARMMHGITLGHPGVGRVVSP